MQKNLAQCITLAHANQVSVLLAGMKLPFNYPQAYREAFENTFSTLAATHAVAFLPFLLEGVGGEPKLNLPDRIHPNPFGHKKMAEQVLLYLKPLIDTRLLQKSAD